MIDRSHLRAFWRVSACAVALAAVSFLTGCSGVVKNLNSAQVNTRPVTIDNVFNLNGGAASLTLGGAATTQTYPFTTPSSPQNINSAQIVSASVALGISPTVTVTVPAGQTLPATFTLTSLSFTPVVNSLSGGVATPAANLGPLTALGTPITLTQTATPGQYTASGPIVIQTSANITGTNLTNLVTLLNTPSAPAQAQLTLNAGSTTLPAGSTITFTVTTNQLIVSTGS